MRVPERFNTDLEKILDEHIQFGLLPNRIVLNLKIIESAVNKFISDKLSEKKVLFIGSRTFAFSPACATLTLFEDRSRFQPYLDFFLKNREHSKLTKTFITNFDAVIISSEYISELNPISELLSSINTSIGNLPLFVIEYNLGTREPGVFYNDDGVLSNYLNYQRWFNKNRSHMHTGFNTYNYSIIKIHDLTKTYFTTE
jgi:hypothetical protein